MAHSIFAHTYLLVIFCFSFQSQAQQKPKLIVSPGTHQGMPSAVFSPDSKLILTSDQQKSRIWDAQTGNFLFRIENSFFAIFSPDGKYIINSFEDEVEIWDIKSQTVIHKVKEAFYISGVEFHSNNKHLIITCRNSLKIYSIEPFKILKTLSFNGFGQLSKSGKYLLLTEMSDWASVVIVDAATNKRLRKLSTNWEIISRTIFTADEKLLLTCLEKDFDESDGKILIWETGTGKKIDSLPGKNFRPRFSPDDLRLITISDNPNDADDTEENNAKIWDVHTRKLLSTLTGHELHLTFADFSPNGKFVVTSSADLKAIVWDAATGKMLHKLEGHEGVVRLWGFDNESRFVLTGSFDQTAKVWDMRSGKLVHTLESKVFTSTISLPNPLADYFVCAMPSNEAQVVLGSGRAEKMIKLGDSQAKIWQTKTGAFVKTIQHNDDIRTLSFSPDGKRLLTSGWDNQLIEWDVVTGNQIRSFIGHNREIHRAAYNPTENIIVSQDLNGELFLWSNKTGKQLFNAQIYRLIPALFDASGQYLLFVNKERTAEILDLKNLASNTLESSSKVESIALSPVNQWILVYEDGSVKNWKIIGEELHTFVEPDLKANKAVVSPDGSHLITSSLDGTATLWNLQTGGKLYSFRDFKIETIEFDRKSQHIYLFSDDAKTRIFNVSKQTLFNSRLYNNQELIEILLDGNILVINRLKDTLQLLDPQGDRVLNSIPLDVPSRSVSVSSDQRMLFMARQDGGVSVFGGDKFSQLLFSLYQYDSTNWVITHPSGLFDASPGAMNKLYFVQGLDIIDFNQLKERYYEPGLWKKVMAGEPLRNVVGFKSIALPPDIQVGQVDAQGYLNIKLTNRGGGIGEVNLFVNGKEAIKDVRDTNVNPDAANASIKVFIGKHKSIVKGQENIIAVKAWNKDHWVQSRGQVVGYHSKEMEQYKPAVHILTCGVSDYTGNEIDLKYAAKDANDVSIALQLGAKKLFGTDRSFIYNFTTTRPLEFYPTKTNILKAFENISASAHPLDVFVMYVSGHGINYGGQDGDWHYLTQEAYTGSAAAYNDPAIRAQTTISSNELVELFKKVPALKQVLVLDACASGKVVDNLMAQKDIESSTLRALDRMRDRTGMHIITGCTADAVSYEASKYGQGVLTYSLLEGIRGAALRDEHYIDVNKLFQYAHDRVPQLAEGIGGIQSPQVFSPQGSQSFDIGLLGDTEKKEVPLAKVRPVYVRSNFQDADELEDVLGLSKVVDASLNDMASKGIAAQIIFVDVREFPEGCRLSGLYQQTGDEIRLKLKKKCGVEETTTELKGKSADELRVAVLKFIGF